MRKLRDYENGLLSVRKLHGRRDKNILHPFTNKWSANAKVRLFHSLHELRKRLHRRQDVSHVNANKNRVIEVVPFFYEFGTSQQFYVIPRNTRFNRVDKQPLNATSVFFFFWAFTERRYSTMVPNYSRLYK